MSEVDRVNPGTVAPVEAGVQPEVAVPPHLLEAANSAIQLAMEAPEQKVVPMNQLVALAFDGARVSREDFLFFKQAVKQDPRLSQFGHGQYVIPERISEAEAADLDSVIEAERQAHLTLLADHIALRLSRRPAWGISDGQVLGMAKAATGGLILTAEEKHGLFGLLAAHPSVDPLENGRFAPRPDADFTPQAENFFESRYAVTATDAQQRPKDRVMTRKQLAKTVHALQTNPETLRARADKSRLATPKRRHRKRASREQGKYHGTKVSLETTLARAS